MLAAALRHKDKRLGEILVDCQLISQNQLARALKIQTQSGGRIGSILYELGYLTMDKLLELLGGQFSLPATDLYKLMIKPDVLELLPLEKMKSYQVLPLKAGAKSLYLAMADPDNVETITDLEFILGKSIQPVVVPALQIRAALKYLEKRGGKISEPLRGSELVEAKRIQIEEASLLDLKVLFKQLVTKGASDLLISAGVPPCLKRDNQIVRLSQQLLTPEQVMSYALEVMNDRQRQDFVRSNELDFGHTIPDMGRFRINIYKQRSSVSIAVRHLRETIPGLKSLGLPEWLVDFALKQQGLILVTGPTGHGKTTTLASLVDVINTRRQCNIITIEDPIEYLHKHKMSNVNQREVGTDTGSFNEGLRHIFRQAPDVIVIGEMRDPESFAIALQAAETGHLVLSTLHSNTATSTVERIIDVFPPIQQQQIRVQFAENFLLILNQRLVPLNTVEGRALAWEKLVNTYRVRNLIRDNKTHQIRTMFQQASEDFQSIDASLAKLYKEGKITFESGLKFCDNTTYYQELTGRSAVR